MRMKQITVVLHYDDDEVAEKRYKVLKDAKKYQEYGSVISFAGRDIVHVEIKGPND